MNSIAADRKRWVDFMMRFEFGLERPDPKRAPFSAATIGGSYIVGGLIPLIPYLLAHDISCHTSGHAQTSVAAAEPMLLFAGDLDDLHLNL